MKPSQQLIDFCKRWETFKSIAYLPTKHDRWTVGYGATFHANGKPVKQGDVMTEADASILLAHRLQKVCDNILQRIDFEISQQKLDAMISLLDNIGTGEFFSTRSGQMFLANQDISARFKLWNHQAGKVLNGLTKRRLAETEIYTKGDYSGS